MTYEPEQLENKLNKIALGEGKTRRKPLNEKSVLKKSLVSKKKKGKTYIVTDKQMDNIVGDTLASPFFPNRSVVKFIKDYFDKNFMRQYIDDIGSDGYPTKVKTVIMLSNDRTPLKTMAMEDFLSLADDKFHKTVKNDDDRKLFLSQVINDWFDGKITPEGLLSVNYLKRR